MIEAVGIPKFRKLIDVTPCINNPKGKVIIFPDAKQHSKHLMKINKIPCDKGLLESQSHQA